jgi:hypothetical protein
MAEDWDAVAAEVALAIIDVGTPLTLEKPGTLPPNPYSGGVAGAPTTYTIYAIPDMEKVRDKSGTLTGETRDKLMVAAQGVVPKKNDRVYVRGTWREILQADVFWQGATDIFYDLTLAA